MRNNLIYILLLYTFLGCRSDDSATMAIEPVVNDFNNEIEVIIEGYDDHAMEPFISRDGEYLFFNNSENGGVVNMDLHYARKIDEVTFEYLGKLEDINTSELEGVATMDEAGNFYFTSLRSYMTNFHSLYGSTFTNGNLNPAQSIDERLSKNALGYINFDSEVSKDGATLYFATGKFIGNNFPDEADLHVAKMVNGRFELDPNSETILSNINTDLLEYAASISSDNLELFFNRANIDSFELTIWRAVRTGLDEPFGIPTQITAITGIQTEGASITDDGKTLYYHKNHNGKFTIFKVSRE